MTNPAITSVFGLSIPEPLLTMALTHKSYASENPGATDNERLEFLGDAVIELAYTEYLYRAYPHRSEGELTVARSTAVSESSLARLAQALELGSYVRLGRGEDKSGGRQRDSVLADAFEALVGALYLGHGWHAARDFVVAQLADLADPAAKDYKGHLQELIQASSQQVPLYRVLKESGSRPR
jgi:ribonuclease-3